MLEPYCAERVSKRTASVFDGLSSYSVLKKVEETTDRRRRRTVSVLNGSVAERGRTDMYS